MAKAMSTSQLKNFIQGRLYKLVEVKLPNAVSRDSTVASTEYFLLF